MTRGPESGWAAGPRASPLPVHLPGVGEGGGVARHSEFGRARPTVRGTWPIGWRPGSAWRALRGVGDEAGPAAGPAELAEAEAGDRPSARRDVPGRRLRPEGEGSQLPIEHALRPARRRLLPARTGRGTITGARRARRRVPGPAPKRPRAVPPHGRDTRGPQPLGAGSGRGRARALGHTSPAPGRRAVNRSRQS